jgi:hypothetical protein
MTAFSRIRHWLALAASVALLAGCAHPQLMDMGESSDKVVASLGEPAAMTQMENGTKRYTYSLQPFGQEVWWLYFDQDGRLVGREQGLQVKFFTIPRIGVWTEKDVWAFWGKCAQEYDFPLVGEHAWMYRFKDDGNFDMAVWPQFDKDGILRSMDITEDPWKADFDSDTWF